MAESKQESKGGIFAKQLQKTIVRTKTKVLQNLGKAERTKDGELDQHLNNFLKQQHDAARLQKDLKQFIHCARELSEASKVLQTTLRDLYEAEWEGYNTLQNINESLELLWLDYVQRLNQNVLPSLVAYVNLFPECKTKIAKRGRKLTDYDNARHNMEALMAAKKKDDAKILRAQDESNEAKRIYDELNNELHDELPVLYDKRIEVYANTFHTLFASTSTLYGESSKLTTQLADILETIAGQHEKGLIKQSPKPRPPRPASASKPTNGSNDSIDSAPSDESGSGLVGNTTVDVRTSNNTEERLDRKVVGSSTFYAPPSRPAAVATDNDAAVATETKSESDTSGSVHSEDAETKIRNENKPRPEPAPRPKTQNIENSEDQRDSVTVAIDADAVAKLSSEGSMDRRSRIREWLEDKRKSETSSMKSGSRDSTLDSKPTDSSDLASKDDIDVEEALHHLDMNIDVDDVIDESLSSEQDDVKVVKTDHVKSGGEDAKSTGEEVTSAGEEVTEVADQEATEEKEAEKENVKKERLPSGVLYQVRVSHKYVKQEEDELELDPGEILNVVHVEEEGWLLGYKVGTTLEGVFPENFTKKIE